jgi:hypothetical protein
VKSFKLRMAALTHDSRDDALITKYLPSFEPVEFLGCYVWDPSRSEIALKKDMEEVRTHEIVDCVECRMEQTLPAAIAPTLVPRFRGCHEFDDPEQYQQLRENVFPFDSGIVAPL